MNWVKAIHRDGSCEYFSSLTDCCERFGIKYHQTLLKLIETGGLSPDGKTFFDIPTDYELEELKVRKGDRRDRKNNERGKRENKSEDRKRKKQDESTGQIPSLFDWDV